MKQNKSIFSLKKFLKNKAENRLVKAHVRETKRVEKANALLDKKMKEHGLEVQIDEEHGVSEEHEHGEDCNHG